VKETSEMETAFTRNFDTNNLQSNLVKQHWASFCNFPGGILWHVGVPYHSKKAHGKDLKFHLTRH